MQRRHTTHEPGAACQTDIAELGELRRALSIADRVGPPAYPAMGRTHSMDPGRRAGRVCGGGASLDCAATLPEVGRRDAGTALLDQQDAVRGADDLRAAILGTVVQPPHGLDIAGRVGPSASSIMDRVHAMVQSGLVARVGTGVYDCADHGGSLPVAGTTGSLRNEIILFLGEPHSRKAVAEQFTVTGRAAGDHLAALCRRGHVVRVGRGVYVRAAHDGPLPPAADRTEILRNEMTLFLAEPRSLRVIAERFGLSADAAGDRVATLRARGDVVRVGFAIYAAAGWRGGNVTLPRSRPQPIRDAIMAFLTEPRSARAIADHIERPVPTATGHLAAMRRRGLVRRLGYSAYARADYAGPPISYCSLDLDSLPAAILPLLTEPRGPEAIARRLGRSEAIVQECLCTMQRHGAIVMLGGGVCVGASASGARLEGVIVPFLREPRSLADLTGFLGRSYPETGRLLRPLLREGRVEWDGAGLYRSAGSGAYPADPGRVCPRSPSVCFRGHSRVSCRTTVTPCGSGAFGQTAPCGRPSFAPLDRDRPCRARRSGHLHAGPHGCGFAGARQRRRTRRASHGAVGRRHSRVPHATAIGRDRVGAHRSGHAHDQGAFGCVVRGRFGQARWPRRLPARRPNESCTRCGGTGQSARAFGARCSIDAHRRGPSDPIAAYWRSRIPFAEITDSLRSSWRSWRCRTSPCNLAPRSSCRSLRRVG